MTSRIVACVDGSSLTRPVCEYAAWSAQRLGINLTLLNVLDDVRTPTDPDLSGSIGVDMRQNLFTELAEIEEKRAKLARRQGLIVLDGAERHLRQAFAGLNSVNTQQIHGDLVDVLRDVEYDSRLLVVGRQGQHGDGVGQHIGHQVERVIRGVNKPVWVIPGEFTPPTRVMIAFDNSPTSRKAIEVLAESALFVGISIDVVMVADDTPEHREQLAWAGGQLVAHGFNPTTVLESGDVEHTLVEYAATHGVDTMIMGAYGHSRFREFLVGSNTNQLLRSAKVPLLLLR